MNVAPSISQQPVSQSVLAGSTVEFSVAATGTTPLSYQWRKDGAILPGGTINPLMLSNVSANTSGAYDVIVSNPYGSATSRVASLVVNVPPRITRPADGDFATAKPGCL